MPHDPRDLQWQRRYEDNDTPWDKGEAAPPLVEFLRHSAITGRVLVPGCGKGHDVLAVGAHPNALVTGLDLAPFAIAQASTLAAENHSGSTVSFLVGNFFRLPEPLVGSFDWIVEHTCFCALPSEQRSDYVSGAVAALKTGGKIFGIFYLTPDVDVGPPFAVSGHDLSRLFDPHFELLDEWVPHQSFPGRGGRELVRILQKR